jgi:uncharacterized protein (DUF4415 family)
VSGKRMRKPCASEPGSQTGTVRPEILLDPDEKRIARTSPPDLADLPADFWDDAKIVIPPPKEPISLRVDDDVLRWFREQGPGYQSRMNAVLRSYMVSIRDRQGGG